VILPDAGVAVAQTLRWSYGHLAPRDRAAGYATHHQRVRPARYDGCRNTPATARSHRYTRTSIALTSCRYCSRDSRAVRGGSFSSAVPDAAPSGGAPPRDRHRIRFPIRPIHRLGVDHRGDV